MSDNNEIPAPEDNSDMPLPDAQIKIETGFESGFVIMKFDPPAVRMRIVPRNMRALAINLLTLAELAEHPPVIQPSGGLLPPSPRG
jgi:hypothetical protein